MYFPCFDFISSFLTMQRDDNYFVLKAHIRPDFNIFVCKIESVTMNCAVFITDDNKQKFWLFLEIIVSLCVHYCFDFRLYYYCRKMYSNIGRGFNNICSHLLVYYKYCQGKHIKNEPIMRRYERLNS